MAAGAPLAVGELAVRRGRGDRVPLDPRDAPRRAARRLGPAAVCHLGRLGGRDCGPRLHPHLVGRAAASAPRHARGAHARRAARRSSHRRACRARAGARGGGHGASAAEPPLDRDEYVRRSRRRRARAAPPLDEPRRRQPSLPARALGHRGRLVEELLAGPPEAERAARSSAGATALACGRSAGSRGRPQPLRDAV